MPWKPAASGLDLFFMVGLKEQTYESVMGTVEFSRKLLARYAAQGEKRVIPFISPLAPFLDPGSQAFEEPEKHGYRLFCRTLEEHRQALLAPSWKYVLNYETIWMNRDQIVDATYEAGRRMNLIKGEFGVIDPEVAEATDRRITHCPRPDRRDRPHRAHHPRSGRTPHAAERAEKPRRRRQPEHGVRQARAGGGHARHAHQYAAGRGYGRQRLVER